jgi:hypothetical protein|eukprot:1740171-Prymnesium_polylepis.1
MDAARLALDAWGAYGLLYVTCHEPFTERTPEYRGERALAIAKAAARCNKATVAASVNKHKSWYFHLMLWVVPLQVGDVGDLWPFGTGPVEQRGARLKRIARSVVSWRPADDGYVVSADDSSQRVFVRRRKYDTCAMMQLLRACVAQEQEWLPVHESAVEVNLSVSERRLLTQGRARLVKEDGGRRLPAVKEEIEEIIDLTHV